MKQARSLIVLGVLALTACGGGGYGGGGGGGGGGGTTYTIGGTVTGLTASTQVVLANNGGNNLTVSSNGSFTFTQPVKSGAAYAVTVVTQPTGETCSVSAGSGTASANVTSVTVTCAASGSGPYTIGGTVSGLAPSTQVVLANNGGNNLTVSSNGSFTFTQPVNSGGAYAVTVVTQPTGETCSVGSGSGTATANVTNVTVSCSENNVAAVNVGLNAFPADVGTAGQTFNIPIVTVTVCDAANNCAPFKVLVDTGSSGLRLIASSMTTAGLVLPPEVSTAPNVFYECTYYADGYAWGQVATAAKVQIAQETATNVPVQVISAGTPTVPTQCSSGTTGSNLNTPDSFSADGVLGVGVNAQDCGTICATSAVIYYSCPISGCTSGAAPVTATAAQQVTNPVALFATDNNGVSLQLPSVGSTGAMAVTGSLTFGIGTEADNALGSATILSVTPPGGGGQPDYLTTTLQGFPSSNGIIDSGSNALYLNDSSLPKCGTTAPLVNFYCPTSDTPLSATNMGANGVTSVVQFTVTNLNTLSTNDPNNYAFNDIAGVAPVIGGTTFFDWGLPFFYGRTVFTIIEGTTLGGQTYANGAFAY